MVIHMLPGFQVQSVEHLCSILRDLNRAVPLRDCTLFLVLCTVQVVFTLNMHKKEITNFLDKV